MSEKTTEPNVVSLSGSAPIVGRSSEAIVKILQRLLEKAQRGEIAGFAWAQIEPGGYFGSGFELDGAKNTELLGAVATLQWRLSQMMLED